MKDNFIATMASCCDLPAEILEVIFKYLDGWSFSKTKEVCKSWYIITKELQKDQRLWRTFCVNEIPEGVIEDVVSFKSIPFKDLIMDWSNVYRRWHKGKMIKSKNFLIKNIQAFCSNPVTCMKISGSWIITGHSNGYILVWNLNTGKLDSKHRVHLSTVTDMALVDLLNLDSYYGFKDLPWSHHHIITGSKDSSIRILSLLEDIDYSDHNLFLNEHGDAIKSIRIFGGKFVASSRDNTITLWSLDVKKKPSLRVDAKLLQTIIGPEDYLLELGFWYDKIYCISHANQLYTYNMKNEWLKQPYFKSNWLEISRRRFIVTAIRVFRDQIIIMFTACAKMIVFIDERNYKVYFLMLTLHTPIVSIALHGTILALGLENGKLYLYYIPNNKALLELDLACPTFQSMLSEASIVSVDVVYNYDSPTVVASTTESLFVVKWNKSRFDVSH